MKKILVCILTFLCSVVFTHSTEVHAQKSEVFDTLYLTKDQPKNTLSTHGAVYRNVVFRIRNTGDCMAHYSVEYCPSDQKGAPMLDTWSGEISPGGDKGLRVPVMQSYTIRLKSLASPPVKPSFFKRLFCGKKTTYTPGAEVKIELLEDLATKKA